jgi:outer membrane murein-binding lipoprotein Lpp
MKRMLAGAVMLGVTLSIAGCGGGGSEQAVARQTVSQGQELQDLQRALEAGAINEKEYEKLKKIVLKRSE